MGMDKALLLINGISGQIRRLHLILNIEISTLCSHAAGTILNWSHWEEAGVDMFSSPEKH
uniref:Uncharacterized protein MANES_09G018100 n=1 Tax=Rhizophora mucronata TaxID=61149 RepID=A0A2P2JJ09_RHIMU